jgi:hypothetical protein
LLAFEDAVVATDLSIEVPDGQVSASSARTALASRRSFERSHACRQRARGAPAPAAGVHHELRRAVGRLYGRCQHEACLGGEVLGDGELGSNCASAHGGQIVLLHAVAQLYVQFLVVLDNASG